MFAAINLFVCLLVPSLFALIATWVSVQALRRHVTVRQLLISAFVVVANVSSVSVLYKAIFVDHSLAVFPLLLITFTFLAAVAQFATATVFSAMNRLRQKMA